MRVTFALTQEKMIRDINQKKEQIDRLSNNVSSGKRLLKPSDDPIAWAQAMDVRGGLREMDTFGKNLEFATGWNQTTDNALNELHDLLIDAKAVGTAAVSVDGQSTDKKTAHTAELDQILQEALNIVNTQYGDRYIFSGLANPTSGAPFTLDAAGNANYVGHPQALQVRTGKGDAADPQKGLQTVSLVGSDVTDFTAPSGATLNMLEELWNLREAIKGGTVDDISTHTGNLDAAQENIRKQQSITGTRLAAFESQQQALSAFQIDQADRLSQTEETDMPEALTQLQQKRLAFEAALRVTSMLDDLSLVKFL